jgi:outer membrane protein assembly factor BamB
MWEYVTGAEGQSSPAVAGGVVFVGLGDGNVYALNATTGALVWKYATGGFVFSSPAVANGVVYVGSFDRNLYALNASTGALVWKYMTGSWVSSSPAVAGDIIYVGSWDDNVYAFGPVYYVAVTGVVSSKTVIGQGYSDSINVTVTNQGSYKETFSVTAYANTIAIATQTVTLAIGGSTTITIPWNTAGLAYGNYTISVDVMLATGETNMWIGLLTGGTVKVTIPGDINGEGVVDVSDLGILGVNWLLSGSHILNPNADINGDGVVDINDLGIMGQNWLQKIS